MVSRGARPQDDDKWRLFYGGPAYIKEDEEEWPSLPSSYATVGAAVLKADKDAADADSPTVGQQEVLPPGLIGECVTRYSQADRVLRVCAFVFRFIDAIRAGKSKSRTSPTQDTVRLRQAPLSPPSLAELAAAEEVIVKDVQRRHFGDYIARLSSGGQKVKANGPLKDLNVMLDERGVLRVGGRLRLAALAWKQRHPIVLPRQDPWAERLAWRQHVTSGHAGPEQVLMELRRRYWIISGRRVVRKVTSGCVVCRRIKAAPMEQKMADLPSYRLNVAAPFTNTGVDLLGPLMVKSGHQGMKVWVVVFLCMRVRAVYLDFVRSIDADSFVEAVQRFHAFYPSVERFHSDQGTNIRGASNLLKNMAEEWKNSVHKELIPKALEWHFVPPHAAWYGGGWERMVAVVKKTLMGLKTEELGMERFRTLLAVAAGIINRRPITRVSADPEDMEPLTPGHFLFPAGVPTPRLSGDVLPTTPLDGSSLRRSMDVLRPVVDSLWKRWQQEYIPSLQQRSKWLVEKEPLEVGSLVLVVDDIQPRERWPLAVVTAAPLSSDGLQRRVFLRLSNGQHLERDIRKVVLLERDGEKDGVKVVREMARVVTDIV